MEEQQDGQLSGEAERLAAQVLLDQNAEVIFKLTGLAMLRRRAGAAAALTADEERLLAGAQRCLEDVARLLPPKCLMEPAAAKRLRQRLQGQDAAAEGEGGGKRQQLSGEAPAAEQQQLEQQQQQLDLPPPPQQLLAPGASLLAAGGGAVGPGLVSRVPQLPPAAPAMVPLAAAGAAAALQGVPSLMPSGSLTGAVLLPGWPEAGGAAVAPVLAPPAASLGSQPGLGQPSPLGAAGEPVAKEEMWLLSQAYGSMTAEQKAKLAAQPPEVRQFVLRERMRKTKEQLDLLQQQQQGAPAPGAGLLAQPPAQPGMVPTEPWVPGGVAQQARMHPQQQLVGNGGASMGQLGALQPAGAPPGMLPQALPSQPPLFSPPPAAQQAVLPGGMPGAAQPAAVSGGSAGAPVAPFLAMSEADRMEHLRRLKRRQEEWLEKQRRAAATLSESMPG